LKRRRGQGFRAAHRRACAFRAAGQVAPATRTVTTARTRPRIRQHLAMGIFTTQPAQCSPRIETFPTTVSASDAGVNQKMPTCHATAIMSHPNATPNMSHPMRQEFPCTQASAARNERSDGCFAVATAPSQGGLPARLPTPACRRAGFGLAPPSGTSTAPACYPSGGTERGDIGRRRPHANPRINGPQV